MPPRKRGFGQISTMRSGRHQARYTGPDGELHTAPSTFDARIDAEAWLAGERKMITDGVWTPPKHRGTHTKGLTFGTYAEQWLAGRPIKPRTRMHYRTLLDKHILPTFEAIPLRVITPEAVRTWFTRLGTKTPVQRAHAYGLFKTVMKDAAADQLIPANPATIRGATVVRRKVKIRPATLDELKVIVEHMPERLQAMTLLAAWGGLRFGETIALRRSDFDLKNGVVRIRRGVVRAGGETIVGTPKSEAGIRDVYLPPHLVPIIRAHIDNHVQGRDGLMFPAADGTSYLTSSSLYGRAPSKRYPAGWGFYGARAAAGRPDLRWHDLRHTGAVLAAVAGSTLADLMARLGHSTPAAAMRYQHAAAERDKAVAARLSELATEVTSVR